MALIDDDEDQDQSQSIPSSDQDFGKIASNNQIGGSIDPKDYEKMGLNPQLASYFANQASQKQQSNKQMADLLMQQSNQMAQNEMLKAISQGVAKIGAVPAGPGRAGVSVPESSAQGTTPAQMAMMRNQLQAQDLTQPQGVPLQALALQNSMNKTQNDQDYKSQVLGYRKDQLGVNQQLADIKSQLAQNKPQASQDKQNAKDWNDLSNSLLKGEMGGRSGEFGRQTKISNQADQVLQLKSQADSQGGQLSPNQMHELALATAALVSGNPGGAAQGTIEALVPHTIGSDTAKLTQWLSDSPQGTNQQAFIQQMFDTATREKNLADEKIKSVKGDVLAAAKAKGLQDQDPQRFQTFMGLAGFGPEDQFDQYGRYQIKMNQPTKKSNASGSGQAIAGEAQAAPGPSVPKVGDIQKGYKFLGGDPSDKNSWEQQ